MTLARYLVVMEAGCRKNWAEQEGSNSKYLNWLIWKRLARKHCITSKEADDAWFAFKARHGSNYPGGNWQESETRYIETNLTPADAGKECEMKGICMWFRNRKIKRAEEAIAYHKGQCEILTLITRTQHTSLDRDELVKARANQRKYEQRLLHLSPTPNDETADAGNKQEKHNA